MQISLGSPFISLCQVDLAMGTPEVFAEGLMAPLGQDTAGKTRVGLGQPLPPSPPSSDVVWVLLPSRRKAALRKYLMSFSLNLALCMFQSIY